MPRLSTFYGIEVFLYYHDEAPPHFHVVHPGYQAIVGIEPVRLIEGSLPNRAHSLVLGWAALNERELKEAWELATERRPLRQIDPLV